MKKFSFPIAIPRWVFGIVVATALNYAVQQKALTPEQAAYAVGLLSTMGVDVDALRRASKPE